MKAIRYHQPGIILLHRNNHGFGITQRINFPSIYHSPYLQETKQYLVLPLEYYVIRCGDE